MRSQFGTSNLPAGKTGWGGSRYLPMAFTEQGVAMLSSVLNSETAIRVNIQIIRVFTKMRELLMTNKYILLQLEKVEKKLTKHDDEILLIFQYLKKLLKPPQTPPERIPKYFGTGWFQERILILNALVPGTHNWQVFP